MQPYWIGDMRSRMSRETHVRNC